MMLFGFRVLQRESRESHCVMDKSWASKARLSLYGVWSLRLFIPRAFVLHVRGANTVDDRNPALP